MSIANFNPEPRIETRSMYQFTAGRPECRPADELIYREDDPSSSLYYIEVGAVRIYRLLADGRRYILSFHCAGEWFGLEGGERRAAFTEAICDLHLISYSLSNMRTVPIDLMDLAVKEVSAARDRQLAMVCQSAIGRVAAFIIEMAARTGAQNFELFMSRRDIADYLGLTTESVARSFTGLTARRAIRMDGLTHRIIHVLSPERLNAVTTAARGSKTVTGRHS
ncbi:helix-turn-helix domain-containing protein [Rhizobium leguminosarum]|uniref:helix-turn-helix domain-containing protein n=1 Tax=Rhizobium leguminosarum TaxID=384 RepID=UPI0021BBFB29|nr:helix-turn-helix domain-containing protein [Rhizobium leguminosarum]